MNNMTDELDSLPDAKLSEVFAMEVAGWKKVEDCGWSDSDDEMIWDYAEDELASPIFATSADAVLPWLMQIEWWGDGIKSKQRLVGVDVNTKPGYCVQAIAPTFARAACIALIRAKRAQKGTS